MLSEIHYVVGFVAAFSFIRFALSRYVCNFLLFFVFGSEKILQSLNKLMLSCLSSVLVNSSSASEFPIHF